LKTKQQGQPMRELERVPKSFKSRHHLLQEKLK